MKTNVGRLIKEHNRYFFEDWYGIIIEESCCYYDSIKVRWVRFGNQNLLRKNIVCGTALSGMEFLT